MSTENESAAAAAASDEETEEKADSADGLSQVERSGVAQDPPPTIVEWIARSISLAVVLGLILYVLVAGVQANDPPDFELRIVAADIEPTRCGVGRPRHGSQRRRRFGVRSRGHARRRRR